VLITKDNHGRVIGWRETYQSKDESVDVSVQRNVSTVKTRDRSTGKVETKTFFGQPILPSDPSSGKK